jgi:ubiquitin-conjugating enzyme E2 A
MEWEGVIFGPDDTEWEGGVFRLRIKIPDDYPNKPPTVEFTNRMFHPNIYNNGAICLDLLQKGWSALYDCLAVLKSIQVRKRFLRFHC